MIDADTLPRIFLFRTGVMIADKNKDGVSLMGERGILVVGSQTLYTIERTKSGDFNSTRLPQKGLFECKMEKTDKFPKGIRITATGEHGHNKKNIEGNYSNLKIHSANFLYQLTGCLTAGRVFLDNGVGESRKAMEDIFTFCGGWGEGNRLMLDVDSLS